MYSYVTLDLYFLKLGTESGNASLRDDYDLISLRFFESGCDASFHHCRGQVHT
jgi:hypothetical protein